MFLWSLARINPVKSSQGCKTPWRASSSTCRGKMPRCQNLWGKVQRFPVFFHTHGPSEVSSCVVWTWHVCEKNSKHVIFSPSNYPSLMAFMVNLKSCGIQLVSSSPFFEMFFTSFTGFLPFTCAICARDEHLCIWQLERIWRRLLNFCWAVALILMSVIQMVGPLYTMHVSMETLWWFVPFCREVPICLFKDSEAGMESHSQIGGVEF